MSRLSELLKSVLAGIMVSMGGIAYLSCDNKYIGSLLFSVGLMTIVIFGFNLYTGKIGYILSQNKTFLIDTCLSIFGNLAGCLIVGLLKSPVGNVITICEGKLNKPFLPCLLDAVLCGILIFVCVDMYKKRNTLIGIFICIPAFILCGFEHSIADMFYVINARMFTPKALLLICTAIIGNAIGGLLIPVMQKIYTPKLSVKDESAQKESVTI